MHLARGKEVRRRVRILSGAQLDALKRQGAAVPVGAPLQECAVTVCNEEIRPGAERYGAFLRSHLDDGNIEQCGEGAVCARESDDERTAACAH